jgi:hypothetical protein
MHRLALGYFVLGTPDPRPAFATLLVIALSAIMIIRIAHVGFAATEFSA